MNNDWSLLLLVQDYSNFYQVTPQFHELPESKLYYWTGDCLPLYIVESSTHYTVEGRKPFLFLFTKSTLKYHVVAL